MKKYNIITKFKESSHLALQDQQLQEALAFVKKKFINERKIAIDECGDDFDKWRDQAVSIKNNTIENLGIYLEIYEKQARKNGAQIHWAENELEACQIIADICKSYKAKKIVKGKSMVSEEIHLNDFLAKKGFQVIETDLGEYIIQLRNETPSHIIAPAVHLRRTQIEKVFRKHHHADSPNAPEYKQPEDLLDEARKVLRKHFLEADVGITGANFLIAQTGSSVIVTNEGNGDLTQSLPKTHIVLASIEKIVPNMNDLSCLLRVLSRSATGQETANYTTITSGTKRDQDLDGPENYHVVLLDNGRSQLLANDNREILRCIRCGACLNHCPVYQKIGGHAYDSVYSGPIGAALQPLLFGIEKFYNLPHASSFCGRCEAVCPMRIPLPKIMRFSRMKGFKQNLNPLTEKIALKIWQFLATRPKLYNLANFVIIKILRIASRNKGYINQIPGAKNLFKQKVLITPIEDSFITQWKRKNKHKHATKNSKKN